MKTGKTILVTLPIDRHSQEQLEAAATGCRLIYPKPEEMTQDLVRSAHIILGHVSASLLAGSQNLEWLQLSSAGIGRFATDKALPPGAILTNASGTFGLAISEHMLAMLLMIQKGLHVYRDQQQEQLWQRCQASGTIEGSTTLVIGYGDIGSSFARRMKKLGSTTIGVKRHPAPKPDDLDELYQTADLDQLLPRADVVALSLPETPETHHLINRDRLAAMKQSAILLNVGRGSAIDTEALCDLLESGHLAGAGLDVTDPEPLPADHRLWKIRNVIITPHVSGGYELKITRDRMNAIAIDNLRRYLNDEPLRNVVDLDLGY